MPRLWLTNKTSNCIDPAEHWKQLKMAKENNGFDPLFVELGLISPKKEANQQPQKKQKRNNNGEDDTAKITAEKVLQQLLETNIVTTDQIRAAHASLKEELQKSKEENTENCSVDNNNNNNNTDPIQEKDKALTVVYRTRHIALHVYYDGKHYSGLAQNVGMESDNSVERQLFRALQTTRLVQSREACGYSRCGRTDKGVSAVGQVVAMQLKSNIPLNATWDEEGKQPVTNDDEAKLPKNSFDKIQLWVPPKPKKKNKKAKKNNDTGSTDTQQPFEEIEQGPRIFKEISEYPFDKMINGLLPGDIRVLGWCPVSEDFSARFSANTRTYRYFFVPRDLNLDAMKEGLKLLERTHDFRNFCKLNVVEVSNFERKIHSAKLVSLPSPQEVCYFQIQGQAFLWHQIRCIVSILFLIGRALEEPSVITELLDIEKHPAKPSYPLASEFPLVLHGCGYPNLTIGYSVQNCWTVTCQLEEQWESLLLEAARVRNCIERLKDVENIRRKELVDFATGRLMERHKKQQRNSNTTPSSQGQEDWMGFIEQIKNEQQQPKEQSEFLTWDQAVTWLKRWKLIPDPNGLKDHIHIPLLQRSKGTTYEEKIEALQQSSTKRSQRYEENAAKKRKSQGTDAEFYDHMLKQGGSGV